MVSHLQKAHTLINATYLSSCQPGEQRPCSNSSAILSEVENVSYKNKIFKKHEFGCPVSQINEIIHISFDP
jgi:hypothetical protein